MPTKEDILSWRGHQLCDRDGNKVGKIEEIYLDADTGEPEWALVNTGLFGSKSTFVPLHDASADGDDVRVPLEKGHIKDAPKIDADRELSQQEEAELYRHYGLEYSETRSGTGLGEGTTTTAGETEGRFARDRDVAPGTSGSSETIESRGSDVGTGTETTETRDADTSLGEDRGDTDDAMTRSEEELHVDTVQRDAGRARLRKYVVTEDVEEKVPVQREEVRVETEPITDENVEQAMRGPDISEAEHEVVLTEEEPVVEKKTVPKERVRLETDTVSEEREVAETVRKEQIDVEEGERREG